MKFLKKITAKFGYIDRLNQDLTNDIEGTIKLAIRGASSDFRSMLNESHKKRKLSTETMQAIDELNHENVVEFTLTK